MFGLHLELERTEDGGVTGRLFVKQDLQGPDGRSHPGVVAAALIEAMSLAGDGMPGALELDLREHLAEGELDVGSPIGVRVDQTLLQDATGTMAFMQSEQLGVPRVRVERAVQYIDHNVVQLEIPRGPNIVTPPEHVPMEESLSARIATVQPDDISTGDLAPDGVEVIAYRSNIPAIAEFTFRHRDPEFRSRLKE